MHIFISNSAKKHADKTAGVVAEYFQYYFSHPYLELDEEIQQLFHISEEYQELSKTLAMDKYGALPDEDVIAEEQEYLDLLAKSLKDSINDMPYYKYGFIPAKKTLFGLFAYMFVHGGWWHLIFNLLYLYVMGPFVEDVWGKPVYTAFYLVTGVIAALGFAMHYPNFAGPLIGASGAISGVMGGFMVRFWHARIRYFYMFTILIRGTFSAPAWLMLPIGLGMDIISAVLMDSVLPEGGGGVAHWAHVWGFIAGVALAFLIKYLKIEEKFVAPKVEAKTTYVNKSYVSYEEAMQLLSEGNKEKAYSLLFETLQKDPVNQDVVEALWNLAPEMGTVNNIAPYLTRLLEKEIQQNHLDHALLHFRFLREKIPNAPVSTHAKIMLFGQSVYAKDKEFSENLFKEVVKEINLSSPPGFLLELCNTTINYDFNFDKSEANQIIEIAIQHPDIPQEGKETLKNRLYAISEHKKKGTINVESNNKPIDNHQNGNRNGVGNAAMFTNPSNQPPPPPSPGDLPPIPIPTGTANYVNPPGIPAKPKEEDLPLIANPYKTSSPDPPVSDQPPPFPPESEIVIPIEPQEPSIPSPTTFEQPPPLPNDILKPSPPQPEKGSQSIETEIPIIPPPSTSSAPSPPPMPPPPLIPQKMLRTTKAIPIGIKDRKIALNIENVGQRVFPLEKIKDISVVKISPPGDRPYILIDLLVDHLLDQKEVIRTIRFTSNNFNPQKFVPSASGPLDAFRVFTSSLLRMTGATPFPDKESVELKKLATFSSVNKYEDTLLKAGNS